MNVGCRLRCCGWCDDASGRRGVRGGLCERCEWVGVPREGRGCDAMLTLLLPRARCPLRLLGLCLRCDWLDGCARLPVVYRADAVDDVALSRWRAEWPGRAA